jgi:hypothetical protein
MVNSNHYKTFLGGLVSSKKYEALGTVPVKPEDHNTWYCSL